MKSIVFTLLISAVAIGARAEDQTGGDNATTPSVTRTESYKMTGEERWRNYSKEAFLSPGAFFASVMPALGDQRANRPAEYGQGWDAFGDRLWRRFAQFQLQTALYHSSAAALGTETRYRPCGCKGGFKRAGYAISRTFVVKNGNGTTVPNLALLGGYVAGSAISNSWYPERYSVTGESMRGAAFQLGFRTGIQVAKEFAPELKRIFRRR